jgi:hypothetical protein
MSFSFEFAAITNFISLICNNIPHYIKYSKKKYLKNNNGKKKILALKINPKKEKNRQKSTKSTNLLF